VELFLPKNFFSKNDMTTGESPLLSDHIVSSKLCDPKVKQYSGYLKIAPDANLFFWFFESHKNPKNSPLTIWFSGGPGYSSMFALFQEIGPCKVDNYMNQSRLSENSWNKVTNLLFIDQPIGAGFSYGALPVMAKLIIQNNNLIKTGKVKDLIPINLKSCGIGVAYVDPPIQAGSFVNFAENNTYKPLLSPQLIEEMRNKWTICKHNIDECYKTDTAHDCNAATIACSEDYNGIFIQNSGVSVYDIRTKNGLPDPVYKKYLDDPFVMESIGVNTTEITSYLEINGEIYARFSKYGDLIYSTKPQVEFLLHNNIPIMFFTGDADYICNWFGGIEVAESLKWERHYEFKNTVFQEWIVDGVKAGEIRKVKNLWFVKVFESGHFVPYSQPRNSFVLFEKWIESLN
ncbi:18646_t:CDS:10, partial [Dentiscutata erythropus]